MSTIEKETDNWVIKNISGRKINGILKKSSSDILQIVVMRHDNYNLKYLKKRVRNLFKKDTNENFEVFVSNFRAGDMVYTKQEPDGINIGEELILPEGTSNYYSGQASPLCDSNDLGYPLPAIYEGFYNDTCYQQNRAFTYYKFRIIS